MALLVPPPLKRVAVGNKRKLQGIAFVLMIIFLLYMVVALYNKQFIKTIPVSLRTDRIGNQLSLNADVKFRGVNVGDVRALTTNGETASLKLAMKPDQINLIPSNVEARILPKTLFGQKYVELVSPSEGQGVRTLREGDVITQDRSRTAIEIEQLYDNLLPFITTVKPEKLNSTLTAIATALEGRGDKLGDNLVRLDDYLRGINGHLPSLQEDITALADYSEILNESVPDLLRFLDNTAFTGRTLVEKQDTLAAFIAGTIGASDTASAVLAENRNRLIQAPAIGEDITRTIARRADNLPLIVNGLNGLIPRVHGVFGEGENENWLHLNLSILGQKGAYSRADCPKNLGPEGNQFGPNCSNRNLTQTPQSAGTATPVPGTATAAPQPGAAAVAPLPGPANAALAASGLAIGSPTATDLTVSSVGSPEEKALVSRIVSRVTAEQAATHDSSQDFATLLLGPMMRGTEVSFQ